MLGMALNVQVATRNMFDFKVVHQPMYIYVENLCIMVIHLLLAPVITYSVGLPLS